MIDKISAAKPRDITRFPSGGVRAYNGGAFEIHHIAQGQADHPAFGATMAYYINNTLVHEDRA